MINCRVDGLPAGPKNTLIFLISIFIFICCSVYTFLCFVMAINMYAVLHLLGYNMKYIRVGHTFDVLFLILSTHCSGDSGAEVDTLIYNESNTFLI